MSKVVFGVLHSKLMQREIPYRVILPKDYESSDKQYPVLYLLHGLFGSCDNWIDSTGIVKYSKSLETIIVLVEGGNGWYVDSENIPLNKFENYIIEELILEVEKKFRIDKRKGKRAIAGLSMGGYGAFKFALKRPDLFCFAASMSGAFIAPSLSQHEQKTIFDELLPSINEAFGDQDSQTREQNDIFSLINKTSSQEVLNLPYFYFDCGLNDVFLSVNREIADAMRKQYFSFEFHEIAGGHDWTYWDQQIQVVLNQAKKFFGHQSDNLK